MKKTKLDLAVGILLCVVALSASPLAAQTIPNDPTISTLSTAGADCSLSTSCALYDVRGIPTFGLYIQVGASGTFNFEATVDGGTWFAVKDDVNGLTAATATGWYSFKNAGLLRVRVRASAISGGAVISMIPGKATAGVTSTLRTPNGDSAMDETLDAVKVSGVSTTAGSYLTTRASDGSVFLKPQLAPGTDTRQTYIVSTASQASTAAAFISIEASAGTGFKIAKVCTSVPPATASAGVSVTTQRRTTASSGGTAFTAEGTTATVSKMDPNDPNFAGVARLAGTPGTAGAVIDQYNFAAAVVGSADSMVPFCKTYGDQGEKMPTVPAGTANGVSINVSAAGAGGLAAVSFSVTIIVE